MTTDQSANRPHHRIAALCHRAGLPADGLRLLRHHATGIYLAPDAGALVRISPAAEEKRLHTAVAVARWLSGHGVPVTEPLALDQPLSDGSNVATFWTYYPQRERSVPPAAHLGAVLKRVHALGDPPVPLTDYRPLASLGARLEASTYLSDADRTWLAERRRALIDAYERIDDWPLERGFVHGDAYPGNTLWDGDTVRLGDWDECAMGPREIDLANTLHGNRRFGRSADDVDRFIRAYGREIRDWPGMKTLIDMRDLHTLGAYIRRADAGDDTAAHHLDHRLATLRAGDESASWILR